MSNPYATISELPVIVVSASYERFRLYCQNRGIRPDRDAKFVNKYRQLMGISDRHIVLFGDYHDLPEISEIIEYLRLLEHRGCTVEFVESV